MTVENVVYSSVLQKEKCEDLPVYGPPKGFGVRHMQALILFTSITVGFFLRTHLSVTMVAMTTTTHHTVACSSNFSEINNNTSVDFNATDTALDLNGTKAWNKDGCVDEKETLNSWSVYQGVKRPLPNTSGGESTINMNNFYYGVNSEISKKKQLFHTFLAGDATMSFCKTYNWSKSSQDMMMYSFFVGYSIMMMPMGVMAQRFGGKIPLMVALAVNGVVSILTPWMAIFGGWIALCVFRLVQGLTQAAFYPSIHTMLGHWAPLSERGRLSSYIYTGSQVGTILAFQLAGLFAGSPSLGWPFIFWLSGLAGLICFGLLAWLGAATPHEHPNISSEELAFIRGDGSADVIPKKRRTPWKHILTSKPVWAMVITQAGSALSYVITLTQTPLYMSEILGVDIKSNGLFSSLPYIAMFFMVLVFGYLADFCVNRNIMSVVNVRRVGNSIGMIASGLFLVSFGYVHSTLLAVILQILYLGTHSGVYVGFHINQIDLAPNFAGPLMALGNTIGTLSGLLAPVLVSCFVGNDVKNQHNWQILFIVMAAIKIVSNMFFLVYVEGTVQPWNFYGVDENESTNQDKDELMEKNNAVVITKPKIHS